MPPSLTHTTSVVETVQQWFEQVVLGLNLCPFAHRPARLQQIRFHLSHATNETELMEDLVSEMQNLAACDAQTLETTLVISPKLLEDFYDYQFFLEEANRQLKRHHWQGVFQLASFHHNYRFAGATPEEASNLTNRSPYPIIHILREESLSRVLDRVDHPDDIPETNIETMENLSENHKRRLFPYLYPDDSL